MLCRVINCNNILNKVIYWEIKGVGLDWFSLSRAYKFGFFFFTLTVIWIIFLASAAGWWSTPVAYGLMYGLCSFSVGAGQSQGWTHAKWLWNSRTRLGPIMFLMGGRRVFRIAQNVTAVRNKSLSWFFFFIELPSRVKACSCLVHALHSFWGLPSTALHSERGIL